MEQHRRVVSLRAVTFPYREDAWRRGGLWFDDVGGDGTQIVAELELCAACAAKVPPPVEPRRSKLPKAKRVKQRGRKHKRRRGDAPISSASGADARVR